MMNGIDVSVYQGNIDFNKVKNAGYDFVIVRAGFGKSNTDAKADVNIRNALAAGLKVGAYWFIYAKDIEHLKKNILMADAVLRNYKNQLEMGVWCDFEYDSDKYRPGLSNTERTEYVKTFIDGMNKLGYKCGLYANPDYINNKFNYRTENKANLYKYPLWLAYYDTKEENAKKYNPVIWQKSSKGKVDGIKGNVDIDVYYGDIEATTVIDDTPSCRAIVSTKKDNLNVRTGNGTKYPIITSLKKDTVVTIITKNGNWYFVDALDYKGDKVQGYVSKTYLKEI